LCHDLGVAVFRYLLYIAVAFSLSVYAYRAYRRWIAPKDDGDPSTPDAAAPSPGAEPRATIPPPKPLPAADAGSEQPKRGMGFTDPRAMASEREPAGESLVQEVIREELAKKHGTPAGGSSTTASGPSGAGRTGLFASSEEGNRASRVSVAAALTGVRLPEDLVPLVGDAASPDPHHVFFHTTETPAAQLGRQLGDELERLGYQVRSESDTVALATKGPVALRITLHPDASNERIDGRARFPTAGPSSVVVELES
jgi:hypothetical protein